MTYNAPQIEMMVMPDAYRCAIRVWRPANPRGRVILLHGVVSHGGWYLATCRHLASVGLEVHFMERRGSGLNLAARGDVDHYRTWIADVEHYQDSLTDRLPTVLCGISWGGQLAAAVARERADGIAGVAMLCPGLFSRRVQHPLGCAGLALAGSLGMRRRRVTIPLQDPAFFTDIPRRRHFIQTDPLSLRKITVAFALANRELNFYATQSPKDIHLPALMMLSGQDRIVDNHKTRSFFAGLASRDKELIEYPDAGHTLEFEPERSGYFEDLKNWVLRIVDGR